MSAEVIALKLLLSFVWVGPISFALLVGPPKHRSWWYPNPDRADYHLKLQLYAFLMVGYGSRLERGFRSFLVAVGLLMMWLAPIGPCRGP